VPGESTAADLEERDQRFGRALSRREVDAVAAMFAPDAVWITSDFEGLFEGREAIRGLIDDFVESFEDLEQETREFRYLGGGATFSVIVQRGRPRNSTVFVERRLAAVVVWADGLIELLRTYTDIDEARATAEWLAEGRGRPCRRRPRAS
jgi:ketosteroid isomerase-like protein